MLYLWVGVLVRKGVNGGFTLPFDLAHLPGDKGQQLVADEIGWIVRQSRATSWHTDAPKSSCLGSEPQPVRLKQKSRTNQP